MSTSTQQQLLAKPIIILPDGISIRPIRTGDEASSAYHANNRKVWLNMTDRFPHPYTEADAKWWINHTSQAENWLPTSPPFQANGETEEAFKDRLEASKIPADYGICHDDQCIGSIGLMQDSFGQKHICQLGYWLGEDFWGKGIMTRVVKAFISWAFDTFSWLLRLEINCYGWNAGSQKVIRKAGFDYESTKRFRCYKDGKYTDLVEFSMLRPGWNPATNENVSV